MRKLIFAAPLLALALVACQKQQDPAAEAARVIRVLGEAVSQGRMARFRIEEIDGARATAHPLASELRKAGAGLHPQGLVVEAAPTPCR